MAAWDETQCPATSATQVWAMAAVREQPKDLLPRLRSQAERLPRPARAPLYSARGRDSRPVSARRRTGEPPVEAAVAAQGRVSPRLRFARQPGLVGVGRSLETNARQEIARAQPPQQLSWAGSAHRRVQHWAQPRRDATAGGG